MDRRDNPYTPNAGAKPPVLVGREQELETFEILLGRLAAGRTEQSLIVVGLRGGRITGRDGVNARSLVEEKLGAGFFKVRLDRTTELQKAYLRAMAEPAG